jgi:hypothetical protein
VKTSSWSINLSVAHLINSPFVTTQAWTVFDNSGVTMIGSDSPFNHIIWALDDWQEMYWYHTRNYRT